MCKLCYGFAQSERIHFAHFADDATMLVRSKDDPFSEHLSDEKPHTLAAPGFVGHVIVRADTPGIIEPGEPVVRPAVG